MSAHDKLTINCYKAEQRLIGYMLMNPWAIDNAPDIEKRLFFSDEMFSLYAKMLEMSDKRQKVTPTAVLAQLQLENGRDILSKCIESVPNDATGIVVHAENVIKHDTARLEYWAHMDRAKAILGGSVGTDGLDMCIQELTGLTRTSTREDECTLNDAALIAADRVANPNKYENELIKTGFAEFDRLVGGIPRGLLTVIGAPPATGKSAFVVNMMANMGAAGTKVYGSVLEDLRVHVANRVLARRAMVDSQKMFFNRGISIDEIDRIKDAANNLNCSTVTINDRPRQTVSSIRRAVARKVAGEGLDILILDHIGEMTSTSDAYGSTTDNAQKLRDMAKEFNIAVAALSQVNRKNRGTMPTKKDLRDSGRIEEFARLIVMLYRPHEDDDTIPESVFQCNVDKSSHGRRCVVELECDMQHMAIW